MLGIISIAISILILIYGFSVLPVISYELFTLIFGISILLYGFISIIIVIISLNKSSKKLVLVSAVLSISILFAHLLTIMSHNIKYNSDVNLSSIFIIITILFINWACIFKINKFDNAYE